MPQNSINPERTRVLNVSCPSCKAAPGQLCFMDIYDSGGKQTKHTNIFCDSRVIKAQKVFEKAMDQAHRIRHYLNDLADKKQKSSQEK